MYFAGILHGTIQLLIDVACCRYKYGKYSAPKEPFSDNIPVQSLATEYTPLPDSAPTVSLLPPDQESPT